MSRIKMGITIALIGLLTGCANNAYLTDEENIPVDQSSGTTQEDVSLTEQRTENFKYEIRQEDGESYAVVTGMISARYKDEGGKVIIPEQLEGVSVEVIGESAFAGKEFMGVVIPKTVERIEENAFQGCFRLYEVFLNNPSCVIDKDAFAGCAEPLYLCYEETAEENTDGLKEYAQRNGFLAIANIKYGEMAQETIICYPEELLHLTPRVEEFFYGENADEEHFLSGEYAEDATDYGWSVWQSPCGEFCTGYASTQLTASSTLADDDDRYSVEHLISLSREDVWAEGAEGDGIGEYIIYETCADWLHDSGMELWDILGWRNPDINGYPTDSNGYPYDGYIRYFEVCVVNGYAKSERNWEENGRVKTLLMYVENRPYAYLELEDTLKPQYFTLSQGDILVTDGGEIGFRFEIVDVYPGSKYEDTCLTGLALEFSGRYGH